MMKLQPIAILIFLFNLNLLIGNTTQEKEKKENSIFSRIFGKIFSKKKNEKEELNQLHNLTKRVTVKRIKIFTMKALYITNGKIVPQQQEIISPSNRSEKVLQIIDPNVSFAPKGTLLVEYETEASKELPIQEKEVLRLRERIINLRKLQSEGLIEADKLHEEEMKLKKEEERYVILKETVEKSKIYAPFDCEIKRLNEFSLTGQSSRNIKEQFLIMSKDHPMVECSIPYGESKNVDLGNEVVIYLDKLNNSKIQLRGKIVNKENFSESQNGSIKIKIEIDYNDVSDEISHQIILSQPVEVEISTNTPIQACQIPEKSTFLENGIKSVFVAQDGSAVLLNIKVVKAMDDKLIVEGIGNGQMLIIEGAKSIYNGDLVITNNMQIS